MEMDKDCKVREEKLTGIEKFIVVSALCFWFSCCLLLL